MSMKSLSLSLVWLALLWSCKEVSYPVPQPAGITALADVPAQLHGRYYALDSSSGEKSDTLIIESWGYHFKDTNDKDWLGRGVLSDSLVIKSYMNYYFVNFRSGNQWLLRVVKQTPSGSLVFLSIDLKDDAQIKEMIKKISKRLKVKEIKTESDVFYQINPTPAQLIGLIQEGYFSGPELIRKK
jgi:hypothetical protein